MSHYWLLIVISCFGTARLQYINTGGPAAESVLNPQDSHLYYSLPYNTYEHPTDNFDDVDSAELPNAFYNDPEDIIQGHPTRGRRTTKSDQIEFNETKTTAKTKEVVNEELTRSGDPGQRTITSGKRTVLLQDIADILNDAEDNSLLRVQDKKNFSPWGGKRRDTSIGTNMRHGYMLKRSQNARVANAPKRVRAFSPWGGKRNGQVLFKQGPKNSRIIFSTSVPVRIMTNYLPYEGLNLAGFHVVPMDKRQAIKFLALPSIPHSEVVSPDGVPVKSLLQLLPKMFKPGRPYLDVNVKKDGKRKVKFSAWGGKRAPPIIGPIWTPASDDIKDATLNALVLIRNSQNYKKNDMATF